MPVGAADERPERLGRRSPNQSLRRTAIARTLVVAAARAASELGRQVPFPDAEIALFAVLLAAPGEWSGEEF